MKKYLLLALAAAVVVFGFSSCDGSAGSLTSSQQDKVVELLTSVSSEAFNSIPSRAAYTMNFTYSSDISGSASFSYTATQIETGEDITGATGGFDVTFTNFVFKDEDEVQYTLNGTFYMEYSVAMLEVPDTGYDLGLTYQFLMWTQDDDTLHISGNGIDADIDIQVINSVKYQYGMTETSFSYKINYDCSGTINNIQYNNDSGVVEGSYSYGL